MSPSLQSTPISPLAKQKQSSSVDLEEDSCCRCSYSLSNWSMKKVSEDGPRVVELWCLEDVGTVIEGGRCIERKGVDGHEFW